MRHIIAAEYVTGCLMYTYIALDQMEQRLAIHTLAHTIFKQAEKKLCVCWSVVGRVTATSRIVCMCLPYGESTSELECVANTVDYRQR